MRQLICLLLLGLLTSIGPADGFKERFIALYKAGKKTEAEQVLRQWEQQQPNDPEAYIMRFNLLLQQAGQLRKQSGAGGVHVGFEQDVARDLKSGKLNQQLKAEAAQEAQANKLMQQATVVLRKGIALAPDRLDMRFGLAKTYEEWRDPAAQVQVLREALADHARRQKPWLWRDGAALPQPEAQMVPRSLEGYADYYWQPQELIFPQAMRGRDETQAQEYGKQLAELIVQYYPESSLGPFNLAVYFELKEQWAPAAEQLKKADALQSDDAITVYSLTNTAIKLKRKQEATGYLARLQKFPDMQEQVAACTKELNELP